jgi:hypothetical protein
MSLVIGSLRKQIIEAFRDLLLEIRDDNGYQTNAGDQVLLGVPQLTPDDHPLAIGLVIGDEDPRDVGHTFVTLPIEAVATARDDIEDPVLAVEAIISDIKKAVEAPGPSKLRFLAKSLSRGGVMTVPREPGSTIVAARVTYLVRYCEAWGAPA